MRAVTYAKTGPSSVLEITDRPKPTPQPAEALIKVDHAGVNFIDIYFRSGLYPIPSFPHVNGREAAGTIEQLGSDVPASLGLKVGDRVAMWGMACMAEYVSSAANKMIKLPDEVTTKQGAALILQGLTAWTLVKDAHEVKKGDWVLVHAAAGGTGGLIVQCAKHLGAVVIGTASTPQKLDIARAHGCDHVIDYSKEDVLQEVMKLTEGRGCEAVFSGVGKATFKDDLECVRRKGTMVTFGNASGAIDGFSPLVLGKKNVKLVRPRMDAYLETDEEFQGRSAELMDLVAKGIVKIDIGGEYPMEEAAKAQDDLAGRRTTGKLVVKIE